MTPMPRKPDGHGDRLRVLTWHVHGSYLHYLAQTPCEFILPVKPGRDEGYAGRTPAFPWGDNVREVPAEKIRDAEIDCIDRKSVV